MRNLSIFGQKYFDANPQCSPGFGPPEAVLHELVGLIAARRQRWRLYLVHAVELLTLKREPVLLSGKQRVNVERYKLRGPISQQKPCSIGPFSFAALFGANARTRQFWFVIQSLCPFKWAASTPKNDCGHSLSPIL